HHAALDRHSLPTRRSSDLWTYKYEDLFDSPEGADQPTARPISMITGKFMDIEAGPNWDDDLGGSPVYAANDPNLDNLTDEERAQDRKSTRLNSSHVKISYA